jgi:hypothetical protein
MASLNHHKSAKSRIKITITWVQISHANGFSDSASITYAKNAGQLGPKAAKTLDEMVRDHLADLQDAAHKIVDALHDQTKGR